jgi:hypothetical protein
MFTSAEMDRRSGNRSMSASEVDMVAIYGKFRSNSADKFFSASPYRPMVSEATDDDPFAPPISVRSDDLFSFCLLMMDRKKETILDSLAAGNVDSAIFETTVNRSQLVAKNNLRQSLLHLGAIQNHASLVRYILNVVDHKQPNVNSKDKHGKTGKNFHTFSFPRPPLFRSMLTAVLLFNNSPSLCGGERTR